MTRTTTLPLCVCLLLAGACGGKARKNDPPPDPPSAVKSGAATAEEAVRGFATAAGKRDLAAAQRFLVDDGLCRSVPPERQKGCPEYVAAVRAQLPEVVEQFPKGFEPGEVKADSEAKGSADVLFFTVSPKGGGEPRGVIVNRLLGRFFVAVPLRRK